MVVTKSVQFSRASSSDEFRSSSQTVSVVALILLFIGAAFDSEWNQIKPIYFNWFHLFNQIQWHEGQCYYANFSELNREMQRIRVIGSIWVRFVIGGFQWSQILFLSEQGMGFISAMDVGRNLFRQSLENCFVKVTEIPDVKKLKLETILSTFKFR